MPKIPTIHLNGSDPQTLLDSHFAVGRAILQLAEMIQDAAPHGRDYYPQGPDAINHAINDHRGRLAALDRLRIDYMEILEGIQRQIDERDARRIK